jgi:hypothetical protein
MWVGEETYEDSGSLVLEVDKLVLIVEVLRTPATVDKSVESMWYHSLGRLR